MNTLSSYLYLLLDHKFLTKEETQNAMEIILTDDNSHQTAAFLAILKHRGETIEEIVGMLATLEKKALLVDLPYPVLDIVGTGGDMAKTVNISTGAAILAAACGIRIAKHGGRSVSSQSGSADVLEAFGINIETSPDQFKASLNTVGIGFLFAPNYHPALKTLTNVRRSLKFPTILNALGPLMNPAKAEYALIGVANPALLELYVEIIKYRKKHQRVLLFHGNGLDELTTLGKMTAYEIDKQKVIPHEIDPKKLGFSCCRLEELQGGDAKTNALILEEVFDGKENAIADTLILNAGAALWIYGEAPNLKTGIEIAREVLKSGKAKQLLKRWIALN